MFSLHFDQQDSYIAVLALAREIATLTRHLRFEIEGQIAKHFSAQEHWEFDGPSYRALNYLMFELSFSPPRHREWVFVTRIHHRSGLFGVFGHGSSNIVGAGIKYRF